MNLKHILQCFAYCVNIWIDLFWWIKPAYLVFPHWCKISNSKSSFKVFIIDCPEFEMRFAIRFMCVVSFNEFSKWNSTFSAINFREFRTIQEQQLSKANFKHFHEINIQLKFPIFCNVIGKKQIFSWNEYCCLKWFQVNLPWWFNTFGCTEIARATYTGNISQTNYNWHSDFSKIDSRF